MADPGKIRKTIDFTPALHANVLAFGKSRGCCNFSEAVRDMVRIVLDSARTDCSKHNPKRRPWQDKIVEKTIPASPGGED